MSTVVHLLRPVLMACAFVMASPTEAAAYVDPGTGSYLFQLAAAGFLAGMFTIRRFWDALKTRFRGHAGASSATDPSSHNHE
jgi:hypothetical protein